MMTDFHVGLVISKKELKGHEGVYEYWVQLPDRRIEKYFIRNDRIEVGQKLRLELTDNNEYKILGIL